MKTLVSKSVTRQYLRDYEGRCDYVRGGQTEAFILTIRPRSGSRKLAGTTLGLLGQDPILAGVKSR